MMVKSFCILFVFFKVTLAIPSVTQGTLLSVVQVHRHGERTPVVFYPNDPFQDISFWNVSEGQLTNRGKRQHFELGQFTRRRYRNFLPLRYAREIYRIQSTNMDRTFMSAAANAAGLFPPSGDQIWLRNFPWQPIPVFQSEIAVMSPLDSCNRISIETYNVITTNEYFVRLNEQYQDLYEYLSYHSGSNITSFSDTVLLWDTLHIQALQNFVLPRWAQAVYPEPLTTLANAVYAASSYTRELQRLATGPFWNAVIEQFEAIRTNSTTQKYIQYSAHDINIASILNTLGAFVPPRVPNFASTIYIEFREIRRRNYINIYYKNYGDIEPVTVAGCDFNCDWGRFIRILGNRAITPREWYSLCASEPRSLGLPYPL